MLNLKLLLLLGLLSTSCEKKITQIENSDCTESAIVNNQIEGCDGNTYPSIENSSYVLPFPPGIGYPTGLTNCSSSYHSAGLGDAYAFDFNMPDDSDFHAIRGGTVVKVVESHPNRFDGTAGNYLVVDHGDETFGLYYHSPPDGIWVEVGDEVTQGQKLGLTGTSGYAGYPHLHLLVVKENYDWPYEGIPISFKNVLPRHTVLKTDHELYQACEY